MGLYTVQKGDTLSAIAKQFRGDKNAWRDIAANNQLENPNALQIGQQLEIEGYTSPEEMPMPTTNPRREHSTSRGNAFGAPPVAEAPLTAMGPSPRSMGEEPIMAEEAISEEPTYADTVHAMTERFGDVQLGGISDEDQQWAGANSPAPEDDARGLLVRDPEILTERADPDFAAADPGPTFDPPTQAKIAAMMKVFEQDPTMVDKMIQLMWGDAEATAAENVTPE